MELVLIVGIGLLVIILCYLLERKYKHEETPCEQNVPSEPVIVPLYEENENGTVVNLHGLEKYGYGDLGYNAPLVNPYSFFFFIIKYKSLSNSVRYSIGVSRGFEEPRIVKYCTYDELEDLTKEKIEYFTNKFDLFTDDAQFNKLVCKYRPGSIIEILKKL